MKHCPSCKTEKDKSLFSKSLGRYDGLQSHCKSCRSSRRKADYIKNKDKEVLVNKIWSNNNPEAVRKKAKRHRQSASGKVYYAVRNASRRSSKLNATPKWLTQDHINQIRQIYAHARECEMLTGDKYHVDHIVPLKGANVCGLHVPWNLQVLPSDINLAKSNKHG